jgi:hypothetical protein
MNRYRKLALLSIAFAACIAQTETMVLADAPSPAPVQTPQQNDPFKSQKPKVGTVTQVTKKPIHHPGVAPTKTPAPPKAS